MTLVFTICSNNYLAQALSLGTTLLQYNTEYIYKIGLVDRRSELVDYNSIPYDIVEVESIGISDFEELFRRYNITELNTAVKPFFFKYFFKNLLSIDSIIYLDPDILIYNKFSELEEQLIESDIIITPHITKPISDNKFQAENDFLNSGLYNLGFIAVKRSLESFSFLDWWADRLTYKAYINFAKGMFTDQIWINFVPLFYKNVSILFHPGYNIAYWNLHERTMSKIGEHFYINNAYPLVFYHFSGFDPSKPEIISKFQDRFDFATRGDIRELFNNYSLLLDLNRYSFYIKIPCYFIIEKSKYDQEIALKKSRSVSLFKRAIRKGIKKAAKILKIEL